MFSFMDPLVTNYVNDDPSLLPAPEGIAKLKQALLKDDGYSDLSEHESAIQHALTAGNVVCTTKNGNNLAAIYTNVMGLVDISPRNNTTVEKLAEGIFLKTKRVITAILEGIHGFEVEMIYMRPEMMAAWFSSIFDNINKQSLNKVLYTEWLIQYKWLYPYQLETNMIPAEVVHKFLYNIIGGPLYDAGYEDVDGLVRLVYDNKIVIEQHPYSKASFKILFDKQFFSDKQIGYSLSHLTSTPEIIVAGAAKGQPFSYFFENDKHYIGVWVALKKGAVLE